MWPTLGVKFIFALVICTEMHIYVRAEWNSSDTTDFQTKPEQQTYGLYIERLENVIQKQSTVIENLQKVVSQQGNRIGRLENISRNNDGNNQATSRQSSLHLSQRIVNGITPQETTMSRRFLTPGGTFKNYFKNELQKSGLYLNSSQTMVMSITLLITLFADSNSFNTNHSLLN